MPDEARGMKPLRVWTQEPQQHEEELRTNVMSPQMSVLAETTPVPDLLQIRDGLIKDVIQKAFDGEVQEDPWANVTSALKMKPLATGAMEADAAASSTNAAAIKKTDAWAAWNQKAGTQDVRGMSDDQKLALQQRAQDKYSNTTMPRTTTTMCTEPTSGRRNGSRAG